MTDTPNPLVVAANQQAAEQAQERQDKSLALDPKITEARAKVQQTHASLQNLDASYKQARQELLETLEKAAGDLGRLQLEKDKLDAPEVPASPTALDDVKEEDSPETPAATPVGKHVSDTPDDDHVVPGMGKHDSDPEPPKPRLIDKIKHGLTKNLSSDIDKHTS